MNLVEMASFQGYKDQILLNLQEGIDFSPKGSIDAPVADLVSVLNHIPHYVTTSSCSGRISVSFPTGGDKGVHWLLVNHGVVTAADVLLAVESAQRMEVVPKLLFLKCEPCILHICCSSVSEGNRLRSIARDCGFRESGLSIAPKKVMLAIRTTSFNLDAPIAMDGQLMISHAHLQVIVSEANHRLLMNFARLERLLLSVKLAFAWPSLQLLPPSSSTAILSPNQQKLQDQCPAHGVALWLAEGQVIVVSGGRAGMQALTCLSLLDAAGCRLPCEQRGVLPSARWGHLFQPLGLGRFLLSGGRDDSGALLSDMFTVAVTSIGPAYVAEWVCHELPQLEQQLLGRAFAAYCLLPSLRDCSVPCPLDEHLLLVHGGLTDLESVEPDDTCLLVRVGSDCCSIRSAVGDRMPRRFGHSLTLIPGQCLLVSGGVDGEDQGDMLCLVDFQRTNHPASIVLQRRPLEVPRISIPCQQCRVHHHAKFVDRHLHLFGGSCTALAFGKHKCCGAVLMVRCGDDVCLVPDADAGVSISPIPSSPSIPALVSHATDVKRLKTLLEQRGWLDRQRFKIQPVGPQIILGKPLGQASVVGGGDDSQRMALPIAVELAIKLQRPNADDLLQTLLNTAPNGVWLLDRMAFGTDLHSTVRGSPKQRASAWLKQLGEQHSLPAECLPSKFEVVGDVLMIPDGCFADSSWKLLIDQLGEEMFWRPLAGFFGLQRVALKRAVDSGPMRRSRVTMLLNDRQSWSASACVCGERHAEDAGWVTVTENAVRFSFDLCQVMFCSGNNTERMRMGALRCNPGEVVVDLYAGIGYYTVPLLQHALAAKVHACEWNPQSVRALRHNLAVAQCASRCEVLLGDNRVTSCGLHDIADRVLLGLLPSSRTGWPLAAKVIKRSGGTVHLHENVFEKELVQWTEGMLAEFQGLLHAQGKLLNVQLVHRECVKSYAPRVNHYVFDLVCRPHSSSDVCGSG